MMLSGDDTHKLLGRSRMDRYDYTGLANPGSRQIYLTFPADSTFREEDVSNYFRLVLCHGYRLRTHVSSPLLAVAPAMYIRDSIIIIIIVIVVFEASTGRCKTWEYHTSRRGCSDSSPSFIPTPSSLFWPKATLISSVMLGFLLNPTRRRVNFPTSTSSVPDFFTAGDWILYNTRICTCRKLQQQQVERGDFSGCSTPTGVDSRDPFDQLPQLGKYARRWVFLGF